MEMQMQILSRLGTCAALRTAAVMIRECNTYLELGLNMIMFVCTNADVRQHFCMLNYA
jgi:hypothetical protein